MVESAVSDIVACTVTAEYPLAAARDEVPVLEKFLAGVATASLHKRNELVSHLAGYCSVVLVVEPLLEEDFHLI